MIRIIKGKYFYYVEVFDNHIVESGWGTEIVSSTKFWERRGRPYLTFRGALKKLEEMRK